jgi:hypothetical protein
MQKNGIILHLDLIFIFFHIKIENAYSHWPSSTCVDMK